MENSSSTQPGHLANEFESLLAGVSPGEAAPRALIERVNAENPIDVARSLAYLERPDHIGVVFDALAVESQGPALAEAESDVQAHLLMHVGERDVALVSQLEPDDAADILEVMEPKDREDLLSRLDDEDADEIRQLRDHAPDTAGGIMTPGFVSVSPNDSVEQVMAIIRDSKDAESIHNLYVVAFGRLVGVFSIRDLILAPPHARAEEFMTRDVICARTDEDREEVARRMETYHLSAMPVVDGGNRPLGIVTADDALTTLTKEASEDVMRMAGAPTEMPTRQSVGARVRARLPWLMVTLAGGCVAALVIRHLGGDAVSSVGRFLPIIGGMAGNVAMQSAAVLVRGFATGEIDMTRIRGMVYEEILVGTFIGLCCGVVAGLIAYVLTAEQSFEIGCAVTISLFLGTIVAATAGTVIPTVCRRVGIDPAITAGPFITTLNDILGFAIYMSVASAMVPGAKG